MKRQARGCEMPAALWLLMRLRLRAWARRITRNLKTVKGIIFTVIFGLMVFGCVVLQIVNAVVQKQAGVAPSDHIERYGTLGLAAYCLLMIFGTGKQSPQVAFTPPEVQFLFAGPFSRRQILSYRIISQFLMTIPISIFFALTMRMMVGTILGGWLALILTFLFLQLFGMAVGMIAATVGELTYSLARKLFLFSVLVALGAAAVIAWRSAGGLEDPLGTLEHLEKTDVVQYGLMPLRWFARATTAQHIDGNYFLNAGLALLVDLALLGVIFAVDAQYLEAAAANSEKLYARLERIRSGGISSAGPASTRPIRRRMPDPIWLGGIGPVAWRQFVTALRSRRAFTILLIVTVISGIGPSIALMSNEKTSAALPWELAVLGLFMSLMMNQAMAFDFRSDVDRMEVLKSLPIPAWRIVVGQLIAPVVALSLYQIAVVAAVYFGLGKIKLMLPFVILLSWPINLLLVSIDNLFFLLFPTRLKPQNPGDFSQAGRQMLLALGKVLGMVVGLGIPAAFAGVTFSLSGRNWLMTILAAFIPAMISCCLPIPLVVLAFRRYDVSRDTPA